MKIRFNCYKDGKHKALTMSYDDGQLHDLRLLEIFNKYGIKGTFHLNSAKLGEDRFVTPEQVTAAYAGHEVSVHSLTHPFLERISDEELVHEITEDRKILEGLCGYPVRGMSYPFGTYTQELIGKLRTLGMQYARTVKNSGSFNLPADFMEWHPTAHHCDPKLMERLEKFKASRHSMPLFYVWGHSYEFPQMDNWHVIEAFCAAAANDPDVWYATNIEIFDYVTAMRSLRFSADRTMVYNPSAVDVWVEVDGLSACCPAGKITKFC
jgi:peptidoglycan/xylan/chitin deacetylase (PgdA/CDA1 family)